MVQRKKSVKTPVTAPRKANVSAKAVTNLYRNEANLSRSALDPTLSRFALLTEISRHQQLTVTDTESDKIVSDYSDPTTKFTSLSWGTAVLTKNKVIVE